MDSSNHKKLEFDRVSAYAAGLCMSAPGQDALQGLAPCLGREELLVELERVLELKSLLQEGSSLPFSTLPDTRPLLVKIGMEGNRLEPEELHDISDLLQASAALRRFLAANRESWPRLDSLGEKLWLDTFIRSAIRTIIDEDCKVRSSASHELKQIRHALGDDRQLLLRRMEKILDHCRRSGWLMEESVAIKNSRLCLPMKVEYRQRIPGFVQDWSGSGQTVFVEPAETLEIANRIQEGEIHERREIDRILREMTDRLRPDLGNLSYTCELLAFFDSLVGRARFALETASVLPAISSSGELRLIRGFHPWLLISHRDREVFPLDLELSSCEPVLIISGPNAGGKSVAMKTIGLLALMLRHGYLLPCSESSVFPFFSEIGIEIGDEQSIENDLSTFSSHLRQVRRILDGAGKNSLVLIDELCSGTDVEEGGAIARSVVEELMRRGSKAIVTTHIGELKAYAHEREGVVNGAMEFDRTALLPTFRFIKGVPGSSFAFAMMQRLGFPQTMLDEARSFMHEEHRALEGLLADLHRKLSENRLRGCELESAEARLALREQSAADSEASLAKQRREQKLKAVKEIQREVEGARREIRDILQDVRDAPRDPRILQEARRKLSARAAEAEKRTAILHEETAHPPDLSIREGDLVRILDSSATGEVEKLKGESAVVLCGNFRVTVLLKNLEKTSRRQTRKADKAASHPKGWSAAPAPVESTTLDIRGLSGDEAVPRVERFIDAMHRSRMHSATIIHGTGTGVLRRRTHELLKRHAAVKSFRVGAWGEGYDGVTILTL
ncbi:endonuclease MutS2 [Chlorobium phaeovibrioides]|uniref:Endonuclease MutS2 n=1 Tax=Chlorobium phaeovibrioides TaxID=1094 RepID=A0A5M8ICS1_CHLPH|nr:Smr/MutS family protein [Chlorobium phaeovibrioides]KAA6232149.1 endonuclease MutS2 [Chlorobium phaeovibrioides]RTY34879.1 endonuclease MutS2 [Chlorobium phaeovibrioides]